jgi:predicted AAA+ superfamily ATPase
MIGYGVSKYLKRLANDVLAIALEASGAVLIEEPKWCGKTRTASEIAASKLLMQDPDCTESYFKAAVTKPSLLLKEEMPRLIDEWQMAPVLWNAVRFAVEQRDENGQFILTGSAVPKDNAVQHIGTARISRIS